MKTVRHLLQQKGMDVWTVNPTDTVRTALQLMADQNIGAVIVLNGGQLVGIFSERDYARRGILQGRASIDTPVRDVMTSHVFTVAQEATIEDCMAMMTEHKIRHLPVMKGEVLIGVISIGDVVRHIITSQKRVIDQLEHYIAGGAYQ